MSSHSTNEFRVGWNNHCDTYSFNSIADPIPSATVGSQYFGSDFEKDSEALFDAIQKDPVIASSARPAVRKEDQLTAVLTPSEWGL
jgi:hypothetical protein